MAVVMVLVLAEHGGGVLRVDDQVRSRSRRTLPTKRSAIALARGAHTACLDDADVVG
jgi:hypothetical protein